MSRRPARAAVAATAAAALLLGGCTIAVDDGDAGASESNAPATTDDGRPNPTRGTAERGGAGRGDLAAEVEDIAARYSGQVGVALANPGDTSGDTPETLGDLGSDVAWSTSKVPIAVASIRATGAADGNVTAAITVSDNAAAEAVWASLGDPATAAQAATDVLRDGGDTATEVNAERVRPEFTAFGQTEWAVADQAVFGANLPCIDGGGAVLEPMSAIAADQRYGLGTIDGARYKGGWGPDESGRYLVREFGVLPTDDGHVGVAVAVRPGDGTYATGQAMLGELAAAIQRHLPAGGTC